VLFLRLRPFLNLKGSLEDAVWVDLSMLASQHFWRPAVVCLYGALPSSHRCDSQIYGVHSTQLTPVLGAQTPALGGGLTPLSGTRKVEAMLGIDRRAADRAAMPPPAARAKQQR